MSGDRRCGWVPPHQSKEEKSDEVTAGAAGGRAKRERERADCLSQSHHFRSAHPDQWPLDRRLQQPLQIIFVTLKGSFTLFCNIHQQMSVLGISLGSHSVYVAVHSTETSNVEVLCDDLGFRSIPTVVGFRAGSGDTQCEVLVGHSAKQQQAKNPSNTFEDLRSLIMDTGRDSVNVPLLDKDISVQELVSHVFRHIFNQVKQQTVAKGSPVKDCFLCLPADLPVDQMGAVKNRLVEAARAGGLRVKGFCEESVGPLVALELDSGRSARAVAAVVDIGWSRSSVSFYSVCNGFFSPVYSISDQSVHAKGFNDACVKFCIKDFMRRCKLDCSDSKRAVTRLSLQCEQGVKILINSQETTIVVDSLFEGMDYSGKISRSRFEDLCGMSGMAIKNMLKSSLVSAGLDAEDIDHVVLAGTSVSRLLLCYLIRFRRL